MYGPKSDPTPLQSLRSEARGEIIQTLGHIWQYIYSDLGF